MVKSTSKEGFVVLLARTISAIVITVLLFFFDMQETTKTEKSHSNEKSMQQKKCELPYGSKEAIFFELMKRLLNSNFKKMSSMIVDMPRIW